jgi:hypothetical protein
MDDRTKVTLAAAVAGGYVLGRTKKGRMALTVATYLAGRRFSLEPRRLASEGMRKLGGVPQVAELQEQFRGEVLDSGRRALTAAANRGMASLADAISDRTARLREEGEEESEKEYGPRHEGAEDRAEYEPQEEEGEYEGEGEEEPESKKSPSRRMARKAAAKKAAAKKTAAKKTAAKKTATSTAPARKSAGRRAAGAAKASTSSFERAERRR